MRLDKNTNLKSILLINDYLSICKLENPNCTKTKLVRAYLSYRLNSINKKESKINLLFYIFTLLLIIK